MEKKILEILNKKVTEMAGHSFLIGIYSSVCPSLAKEITSHVMEFIKWINENMSKNLIWYDPVNDTYELFDWDYEYSLNELYQYWLNNIKSDTKKDCGDIKEEAGSH